MAERRMFAKTIIDSDAFVDMPLTTQALYFHLAMRADDEGFINNHNKICRMISANKNDMDMLIVKRFIIPFDSGVCVVKHWRIHNYIQSDRFKETFYQEEKQMLGLKENKAYTLKNPLCIQTVSNLETQDRLGKDSLEIGKVIDKDNKKVVNKFTPPTIDEIQSYCDERNNKVDAERFFNFYEMKGWLVGKSKMKDWKAAVRTWEKNDFVKPVQQSYKPKGKQEIIPEWMKSDGETIEVNKKTVEEQQQFKDKLEQLLRGGK